jgi:superfamily II DNA or RNA helicase
MERLAISVGERSNPQSELGVIDARLAELAAERAALEARRVELLADLSAAKQSSRVAPSDNGVSLESPVTAKVEFFLGLFVGRRDVFALRWENAKTGRAGYAPACANEWVPVICGKPKVKCAACPNRAFLPLTPEVIEKHLRGVARGGGDYVVGLYPLLHDDTCMFLAVDFDGEHWSADALAFVETCREASVPATLERSRSGAGGHVWVFFAEPVSAAIARRLGALLITRTMNRRPEIGFKSYDRMFPSQDTMPTGGFGNLIALPLQRRARDRGDSAFIGDDLKPFDDQWTHLAGLRRMSASEADALIHRLDFDMPGGATGVRLPVEDESANEPWKMAPSRRAKRGAIEGGVPAEIQIVISDQIYVARSGLPPPFVAQIIRLAAFQNPEFYRAQAMRMPTYGKPRIVSCAELFPGHIGLPRGCLDEVIDLLCAYGVKAVIKDERFSGKPIDALFSGSLHPAQVAAVADLAAHDTGVLAATTAFGKTVVGACMIAERRVNTLVLVHRAQLLDQWRQRLSAFLSIDAKEIGLIGGGKFKPTGKIDVALIQSLVRKNEVNDQVGKYGHLIVDECHHLSAVSFELVARRSKARYVLGLSATIARKDGHHPIIFMQCGPVRHRVDAKSQAATRAFSHRVIFRGTGFVSTGATEQSGALTFAKLYADLARDERRNDLIFDDVMTALQTGRRPLILTERRDHMEILQSRFAKLTNLIVLSGAMRPKELRAALDALQRGEGAERLILATGRFVGEGFDEPSLDTLFLTMPISWKGTLAQYVGRLHRLHQGKTDVVVYDYVDTSVTMLSRMAAKRRAGYRSLGYALSEDDGLRPGAA